MVAGHVKKHDQHKTVKKKKIAVVRPIVPKDGINYGSSNSTTIYLVQRNNPFCIEYINVTALLCVGWSK